MTTAGRWIVAFREDEIVVAAAADADARSGERKLLTAPASANRSQPKHGHYGLRTVSLALALPVNDMMANSGWTSTTEPFPV